MHCLSPSIERSRSVDEECVDIPAWREVLGQKAG